MKYINLQLAKKRDFAPYDVMNLITIEEQMYEEIRLYIFEVADGQVLRFYESLDLVEYIKGSKSQPLEEKIRLSKKGRKWLRDFFTLETEISEDAIEVYKYLQDKYEQEGKKEHIVYQQKTKTYIQKFMDMTGYSLKHMVVAIDKYFEITNPDYLNKSDTLFFKLPAYSKKLDLGNSKLYSIIVEYLKK